MRIGVVACKTDTLSTNFSMDLKLICGQICCLDFAQCNSGLGKSLAKLQYHTHEANSGVAQDARKKLDLDM